MIKEVVLCFCLIAPVFAWTNSIQFVGVDKAIENEIRDKYKNNIETHLDLSILDDIIRTVHLRTDGEMVEVISENGGFIVKLAKSTRVGNISIQGERSLSVSQIKNILGVSENDVLDTNLVLEGAEKVRKKYYELGFLNATVDIEIPEAISYKVPINITINEGLSTKVSKFEIVTTNESVRQDLTSLLKSYVGENFRDGLAQDIQSDIKDYFKKNLILQGEVQNIETVYKENDSKVEVKIVLANTHKFLIDLDGYKELSRRKLLKILDLGNYSSTNPNVAAELSIKIKNFYLQKGYARVDLQTDVQDTKSFEKKITIRINEGPKISIEKISIQGLFELEETLYVTSVKELIDAQSDNLTYVRESVEKALEQFKIQRQNSGYLSFTVTSFRTIYNTAKDKVNLIVTINEGPLTILDSVQFIGNKSIPTNELMEVLGLNSGQPLDLSKLEKTVPTIKARYQEKGFLEVSIENEKDDLVSYFDDNKKAKLKFDIKEGPQVRVGSIAIEGNIFTKDEIILIELEFSKGDILTPNKIEESILRLQKTGFFSTVEIRMLEQRTSITDRTIVVKVVERDPGIFTLGFGATNERNGTIRGYSGLGYRNIKGTGRGISGRVESNYNIADIKYPEMKIIFGYVEPYLFKSRLRGRVNISRSRYVNDSNEKAGVEKNQYSYSIERDFTSKIVGIFEVYNLEQFRDFWLRDNVDTVDINEDNLTTNQQNIASLGPTLDIDFRDNPFLPTKGTFTRFNAEYASPQLGSTRTIEYYKWQASFTHYFKIHGQWVWANNFRYGFLENLSHLEDGGVPYSKKGFRLGGITSVRGFDSGEFFPNNLDLGITQAGQEFYLKTFSQMSLFKSEIRFPIYENFFGGVFYDLGAVKIEGLPVNDLYRDSAGVGLRYNTPIGALNMEIGHKLDPRDGENKDFVFHLSFGTF